MPPPCNVIFKGKGYRFEGSVPPYNPYLRRKTVSIALMALSVGGMGAALHYRGTLDNTVLLVVIMLIFVWLAYMGVAWYRKASDANNVFISAPRNCSITSTDSEVFYARK